MWVDFLQKLSGLRLVTLGMNLVSLVSCTETFRYFHDRCFLRAELSDTQSLWALNTGPPRNRFALLFSSKRCFRVGQDYDDDEEYEEDRIHKVSDIKRIRKTYNIIEKA